jgi:hypothetical protein
MPENSAGHPTPPSARFWIPQARDWRGDFAAFRNAHPDWPIAASPDPLYALTEAPLRRLKRGTRREPPLIDRRSLAAEHDFAALCGHHHAVGTWDGHIVQFPLLRPTNGPATGLPVSPWGGKTAQTLRAEGLSAEVDGLHLRLRGVVGWLLTEPEFLSGICGLREQWRLLPDLQRPAFPLGRRVIVRETGADLDAFGDALLAFLDRWSLTRLVTWDLPEPQAPRLPELLPADSPLRPVRGVHITLPLHYALARDDDLLRRIIAEQLHAVRELGVDESLAGLPHHQAYARMFDVLHLERTLGSRFPGRPTPRGLVSVVEQAAADQLGISPEQVRRHRKAVALCRKGQRQRVRWLRPSSL